jgi:hypothetical protein
MKKIPQKEILFFLVQAFALGCLNSIAAQEIGNTKEREKGAYIQVILKNGEYKAEVLEAMTSEEREMTINNLNEYTHYPEGLQKPVKESENIPVPYQVSDPEPLDRDSWHLTFTGSYKPALAANRYITLFEENGFGDDEADPWNTIDEYPRREGTSLEGGFRLRKTVEKPLNIGGGITLSDLQEIVGHKETINSPDLLITERHRNQMTYAFVSISNFPENISIQKNYAEVGAGVGYNRNQSSIESVYQGKRMDTNHNTLGVFSFFEFGHYFGDNLSLGFTVEGSFLPNRRIDPFQIEYEDYNGNKLTETIPSHKVNFGSLGVGVQMGLHF